MKVNFEIKFNKVAKIITGTTLSLLICWIVYANNWVIWDLYKYATNDFWWNYNSNSITIEWYRLDWRNILKNSITSEEIMDWEIRTADLADNSVTSAKLDNTDLFTMSWLTINNNLEVDWNITSNLPIANTHSATKQYVDTVVWATSVSSNSWWGWGGTVTLVWWEKHRTNGSDTIINCPTWYISAMQWYWQCPYITTNWSTAASDCFCSSESSHNYYSNSNTYFRSYSYNSSTNNYYRCNVCVQTSKGYSWKRIFVTSNTYTAGTEAEADNECQISADFAWLDGNFKSMYLDGTWDLRITDKFRDAIYKNIKWETVLTRLINSTIGTLENPISYDEFWRTFIGISNAWTGMNSAWVYDAWLWNNNHYWDIKKTNSQYLKDWSFSILGKLSFICVEY